MKFRQKKSIVRRIGGSSNGRTAAFEAVYEGPTPSPPARIKLVSEGANFSRAARSAAYAGEGFSRTFLSCRVRFDPKIFCLPVRRLGEVGERGFLEGRSFLLAVFSRVEAVSTHSRIGSIHEVASLSNLSIFSSKLFFSEKSFERSRR